MPNWSRVARQVNRVIQKRGGPESVKEDAEELAGIAREKRPIGEKLKEATKAIKEPGAAHGRQPQRPGAQDRPGGGQVGDQHGQHEDAQREGDPGQAQDPGPQQVPGEQHAPGPAPAPGREPDPSPRGGYGGPREGQAGA